MTSPLNAMFPAPVDAHEGGYTFIEIVVVLALVGIVWATAAPRLPVMLASYQLQNTVEQVANDLRLARMQAITQSARTRIRFGGDFYVLQVDRNGDGFRDDGAREPIPSTVSLTANAEDLTFNSRGLTAAPYTITVSSTYGHDGSGGATKTISVSAIGRVSVRSGES